jgi:hypothetical protein
MKKVLSSVAAGSLLLILGAGCANAPAEVTIPAADPNAAVVTPPPVAEVQVPAETAPVDQITLTGEALGGNKVKFSWVLPSGMTDPSSFRLVRGPKENPASPGNNYFQLLGGKREITWVSLPTGKQNFRICTFKEDTCDVYSNNIEMDVK